MTTKEFVKLCKKESKDSDTSILITIKNNQLGIAVNGEIVPLISATVSGACNALLREFITNVIHNAYLDNKAAYDELKDMFKETELYPKISPLFELIEKGE